MGKLTHCELSYILASDPSRLKPPTYGGFSLHDKGKTGGPNGYKVRNNVQGL